MPEEAPVMTTRITWLCGPARRDSRPFAASPRASRPARRAERLQRVEELLRVDALLLQPLGEHLLVGGVQPLAMDGVEERPVQLVEHAERLEAVEDRGVLRP